MFEFLPRHSLSPVVLFSQLFAVDARTGSLRDGFPVVLAPLHGPPLVDEADVEVVVCDGKGVVSRVSAAGNVVSRCLLSFYHLCC
jgi:hypothetical protein